ncbi:MAG: hypothetical protein VW874_04020 [Gammaproteobacteria bacterium]
MTSRKPQKNQNQAYVALAKISRELYLATSKAQEVSLIAKNARALAVRAGDKVLGFKAITDFIDDLATSTIQLARQINKQALDIAHMAAEAQRKEFGLDQFEIVMEHPEATHAKSITKVHDALKRDVLERNNEQRRNLNILISNLNDIQQEIRSAGIIALNAKVESAKTPEYQASLDVIADDILHSTNQIKERIDRSQSIIKNI